MSCHCPYPERSEFARSRGTTECIHCGRLINAELVDPDHQLATFFDHLEAGIKGAASKPPPDFVAFRQHCQRRERQGRDQFGLSYLRRDNIAESLEEFCDGAIYMALETIKLDRGGEGADRAVALQVAFHAFEAYRAAIHLAAKRAGSP